MNEAEGFALWLTGMPASGKSSITRELAAGLKVRTCRVVVLESDEMRKILTPEPTYSEDERDGFYRELAQIGAVITRNGINVIFDATANKRAYRDHARAVIPGSSRSMSSARWQICTERDPKGIYAMAATRTGDDVPGVQAPYEPPSTRNWVDGQADPAANAATNFR